MAKATKSQAGTSKHRSRLRGKAKVAQVKSPQRTQALVAYEHIRNEILTLGRAPGAPLDERSLSAELGMSRSPVREALHRLSAEGLIEAAPNRTSVVTKSDFSELFGFLELQDVIYRLTARLAALGRGEQDLARMVECNAVMTAAIASEALAEYVNANHDFHVAVGIATRNRLLAEWTRQLLDRGQRTLGQYVRDVGTRPLHDTPALHDRLIDAIRRQDADAAEAAGAADADQLYQRLIALWCNRRTVDVQVSRLPAHTDLILRS